jgi:thiamine biosynthesis lipoprotein
MDTVVTIEIVGARPEAAPEAAIERALRWFGVVEHACSRFEPDSELRGLTATVGRATRVSPVVFEAIRFALALADRTAGAFDPTVGRLLEARGFDRSYRTGRRTGPSAPDEPASYRDVQLDEARHAITLRKPLVLDVGAVAKGLAIDLAARELIDFADFCVEAGGDLYARGRNGQGEPWRIGIQDPRDRSAIIRTLTLTNQAVCTSGDYERRTADGLEHHLVDPRTRASAHELASVTVVAPTAMAADGLATAAFVLGPRRGRRLLEREGVAGVLVAPDGQTWTTSNLKELRK